jgi:undecaprenyl-diphosphatase
MNIIEAIIFGIVEGITEFLPISSTGHLILTARLLGHAQTDFLKSFEVIIQLGAVLSVIVLYGDTLLCKPAIWRRVAAAFVPTAVVGFVLYKIIKKFLFADHRVILCSLFLGGLFLVIFDSLHKEDRAAIDDITKIPYRTAVIIGLFQSLAMVPGVSRAAATIIGGLMFGIKRKTIVEFSFLLAIPTMLAATGYDMMKNAPAFTPNQTVFLIAGFVVSFAVALVSVKFLIRFIQTNNFILFGVYRMVLPLVWFLW